MAHPLIDQLRFTRGEWRRALRGVPEADGARRLQPMNTIGWIVGHLAWQEQRYFLTRAQGQTPLAILDELVASGGPPSTPSLKQMLSAWKQVARAADDWLDTLTADSLLEPLPPPGPRRTAGDAIHRVTYHYWFHIGEVLAIRQMLGHSRLPEFVSMRFEEVAPYRPA